MLNTQYPSAQATEDYLELLKMCLTGSAYDESAWRIEDGFRAGRRGPIQAVRQWIFRQFAKRGYVLVKTRQFDAVRRAEGRDWPLFGYSMAGTKRLDQLQAAIKTIVEEKIPGDFLEAGVWRGGAAMFMKAALNRYGQNDRVLWLADSFEGLPKPSLAADKQHKNHDLSECDFLKVSQDDVAAAFERFGLLDSNVRFLKGWFCDSLPTAPVRPLALLRLDGDLYESTMDILKPLYNRVVPGGYVVVDDYHAWSGCRQAIDEFRAEHEITAPMEEVDGTAVFWRIPGSPVAQRAAA